MSELDPVIGVVILLVAALVGGMIAHRLRQPVVLGYLIVGVIVGPHALGLVGDLALVQIAATIGVALLMFTLGLEISVNQLREAGKVGLAGGIAQIMATFALGLVAGITFFHWPLSQATLFGLIISLSSTAVCYKILAERSELDSVHGRIMIAILIVQDISVMVMAVAVPLIGSDIQGLSLVSLALFLALGKVVLFTGAAIMSGLWVLPWLMGRVGGIRSRELFLLTILVLSLGAALGTQLLGLSAVFGAFLVGLVLRETIFAHQALAEITPLRDIFATLFFVSLGMLLSPSFLVSHWLTVLLVIAVIILIKFSVVGGLVRFFGFSWKIAVISGAGLLQIGEFGFILAQAGINAGVISEEFYSLILAGAIITMLLTPVSISLASRLSPKLPWASTILPLHQDPGALAPQLPESPPQVIIAGYGRIGQHIAQGLDDSGIPYTILDIDPERIAEARSNGRDCLYGDVSNPRVLAQLDLSRVGTLVITFPDPVAVVTTVKIARQTNPKLKIVARVHRTREAKLLTRLGDVELISPEYEASLEFIRRILITSGWSQDDIQETLSIVQRRRGLARYSPEEI